MKPFLINYTIRSGIDQLVVREEKVVVHAVDIESARKAAGPLIEESPYFDLRIDPYFEINNAEEIDSEEEDSTSQ
jgi:hypothetical protein